jgi:HYR domain
VGFREGSRLARRVRGSRFVWLAVIAVALLAVPSALGDPPTTTITNAPPTLTASNSASFSFVASDSSATFECNLDGSGFAACASPAAYGPFGDGGHTFAVRGTTLGADGGTGPAAQHAWTVDTTPPAAPTIVSGPIGTILEALASLGFVAPEGTPECSLDGGGFAGCSSPYVLSGLADGPHSVVVRAVDGAGNASSSAPWSWVVDATAPGAPTITGGPTGTVASASASITFVVDGTPECSLDGGTFAACTSPHQLAGLADGAHAFAVRAVDAAGNRSPASTPRTWTVDTTPPATPTITGGPTGTVTAGSASLSFQADELAQCSVDGGGFSPCSSPHELGGLADGTHSFAVRAVDAVGNQSPATPPRTWVVDTTKPALTLPSGVTVEANGPGGSVVQFEVAAVDRGAPLPPSAIQCSPRSGAQFPLGRTTVGCAAVDTAGNRGEDSFTLLVRDSTAPTINAPDVTVTAPRAAGIRKTDAALATYLNGVRATDLVSAPTVTNDAPDLLPVGRTRVTFTARDAAGNAATSAALVTVQQPGRPAPPVDVRPPAEVGGVRAVSGDHAVTITWSKPARDVVAVGVFRNPAGRAGNGTLVYRGLARRFVDRKVANGVRYRYVVATFDRAGNRSRGVVRQASPVALLLVAPRPNARVSSPPLLRWAPSRTASYYNVQVWRDNRKILSAWPAGTQVRLPRAWSFEGRRYRLTPGLYTWYVWPGLGAKADARYGQMLGRSTFRLVPPV